MEHCLSSVGPGLWRDVLHLAVHWLIMYRPVIDFHLFLHMRKHRCMQDWGETQICNREAACCTVTQASPKTLQGALQDIETPADDSKIP